MAVSSSLLILGLTECQRLGNGTRPAVELDLDHVGDVVGGERALLGAVGLHEQGQGLRDADGVRELHQGALAESALDDGLRHLPADVGSRSIDLGRILTRESTASVGTPATVGVDDDLSTCQAGITLGPSDDELAGGVDVEVGEVAEESQSSLAVLELDFLEGLLHNLFDDQLVHVRHAGSSHLGSLVPDALAAAGGLQGLGMLSGDDDGVDFPGLDRSVGLLHVLDGDLGLTVGPQPPEIAVLADVRQLLAESGGHGVGQGHTILGLVGRVSEHDALIAGTDVKILLAYVDASGDVRALLVDADENLASLVRETLGVHRRQIVNVRVEPDLGHHTSDNLVIVNLGLGGDLTCDHDHVVLGGRLAGNLALGIGGQASIQDGIRDLIADLVRVALVDGLGGEEEDTLGPGLLLSRLGHGGCWKGGLVEKGNLEK
mmetsp:Transcript_69808/g.145924  ORF Transcript_69808/g.145924 Transcript_69808/m.145924 type:complete len:433 (-) Transcript_69808:35-1333(-)